MSGSDSIEYRTILPGDFDSLKRLHEEMFPVRYSKKFYEDAVMGIGLRKKPLYSLIAVKDGGMIGFVLGQFMSMNETDEKDLIDSSRLPIEGGGGGTEERSTLSPAQVDAHLDNLQFMYILTLGCIPDYRRKGLASALIKKLISHAKRTQQCAAVYLHVIHYNQVAINFYTKQAFEYIKTRYNYYEIDKQSHSAYVYALFINNYLGHKSLFSTMVETLESTFIAITAWFSTIPVDAIARTLMNGATRMMQVDPRQMIVEGSNGGTTTSGRGGANSGSNIGNGIERKREAQRIISQAEVNL